MPFGNISARKGSVEGRERATNPIAIITAPRMSHRDLGPVQESKNSGVDFGTARSAPVVNVAVFLDRLFEMAAKPCGVPSNDL